MLSENNEDSEEDEDTPKKMLNGCTSLCEDEVLLIDDNLFNLYPLMSMLESSFNIKSTSFSSGVEALQVF